MSINWQAMGDYNYSWGGTTCSGATFRAKVNGGWLVKCIDKATPSITTSDKGIGIGVGLTFVPDPDGAWKG